MHEDNTAALLLKLELRTGEIGYPQDALPSSLRCDEKLFPYRCRHFQRKSLICLLALPRVRTYRCGPARRSEWRGVRQLEHEMIGQCRTVCISARTTLAFPTLESGLAAH
jgi:hypothetical protein